MSNHGGILDSEGWSIDKEFSEPDSPLLVDLLSFYYADRLYLLRSINLILSHRASSDQKSEKILQVQTSIKSEKILEQLEQMLKSQPVPARSRDLNSQMISIMHLQSELINSFFGFFNICCFSNFSKLFSKNRCLNFFV